MSNPSPSDTPSTGSFTGWLAHSPTAAQGQMSWTSFTPKTFTPSDVDIQISHCGICGSDIHTLRSGWGPTRYPLVVGHEIIGRVTRVGSAVPDLKVGDRVGVGAQVGGCVEVGREKGKEECEPCTEGRENYCARSVHTYNGRWPDGKTTQGGYATTWRGPARYAFRIPDGIRSVDAAPMMCGGVTMYSPLVRAGVGPGKTVGIVGLGGLGHFGVLFAKALGAEKVVVISRTDAKREDARKLGASGYIATSTEAKWWKAHRNSLDVIVSTVSSPDMPLGGYLSLLKYKGEFIQVGAPEDQLPRFPAFALIQKNARVCGSSIGSPEEIREMLRLVVEKGVRPWVQERGMEEANRAIVDFEKGVPRYRFVLVNGVEASL